MTKENVIVTKSFNFALSTVETCKMLQKSKEYVLSKQLIRSGTSIGANIREAQNAQSKKDFIHKLSISQKECDESIYWLELLYRSNYISNTKYHEMTKEAEELLRILKSIIISSKRSLIHNS